jgi:hypothetical protein
MEWASLFSRQNEIGLFMSACETALLTHAGGLASVIKGPSTAFGTKLTVGRREHRDSGTELIMNSKLMLVLLAAILLLAGLTVYQTRRTKQEQARSLALRSELEQRAQQVRDLERRKERAAEPNSASEQADHQFKAPVRPLEAGSGTQSSGVANLALSGAPRADTSRPEKGGLGELVSKMMRDPETRQFIQDQQRQMMDQLYAPLIKQLGLSSEESNRFKELLADQALKAADRASALFGNGGSNRTDVLATAAADTKAQEEQVKSLLGEARYAQYKEYQQTAGDRMQLNLFKQQSGGEAALTEQQTEQLLGLIKDERQTLASAGQPVPGTVGAGQDPSNLKSMISADQTEQMLANQEGINLRVFERAKAVLSPEQLQSFGKFQTNQLQMMRMGMTMARKLLGPDGSAAPAPTP